MRVKKIFNNSVVSAMNNTGEEVVIMGRGLGFDKKEGDIIPENRIEKIFVMDKKSNDKFKQILGDISLEHFKVSDDIITMAKQTIGKSLSEKIYITLTDHISYAIERYQKGVDIHNAMLFEIKSFYNLEFTVGQLALKIIENQLGVKLPDDEAGFIALHLVNAELDSSMEHMQELTIMIKSVLDIVRFHFKMDFEEDSIDYKRFVLYIRGLGSYIFERKKLRYGDTELKNIVCSTYPEAFRCAEKIGKYIQQQFNVVISEDDEMFLTVYIHRLTNLQR